MDPERWRQIEELYHAALEHSPETRQAFLAGACRHDADLRREVESLLIRGDQAGSFLETPAMEATAMKLTEEAARSPGSTSFTIGQAVSHYRIESKLGEGSMGGLLTPPMPHETTRIADGELGDRGHAGLHGCRNK